MLSTVANDLAASGHEVSIAVNGRLVSDQQLAKLRAGCRIVQSNGLIEQLPAAWWEVARSTDATIVIAPEFNGALEQAIVKLRPIAKLLCNSYGDFLANSCDKWRTAQCFAHSNVPHPETRLLCDVTQAWLTQHASSTGKWIVKPRDGAGCEGIELVDCEGVMAMQTRLLISPAGCPSSVSCPWPSSCLWIVQPFIAGLSFSRSAIVGCDRNALWLPVVTQEFLLNEKMLYRGGKVLPPVGDVFIDSQTRRRFSLRQLDELLNSALVALGPGTFAWLGFHLLYAPHKQQWLIIEANPRMTTSFSGLAIAGGHGLMDQMLRACTGKAIIREGHWDAIAFQV